MAVLGKHLDIGVGNESVCYDIRDQIKVLAILRKDKSPNFPDVPVAPDLGLRTMSVVTGLAVQKGTPQSIIDRLGSACAKVLKDKALDEAFQKVGATLTPLDRQEAIKKYAEARSICNAMFEERKAEIEEEKAKKK